MDIAYNPGLTGASANSHTDWTGGGGLINSLGPMLGGLNSDPAQPGSGKPGSPATSDAASSGTGAPAAGKGLFWALVVVAGVLMLAKKF
jgi:hypothetical protein